VQQRLQICYAMLHIATPLMISRKTITLIKAMKEPEDNPKAEITKTVAEGNYEGIEFDIQPECGWLRMGFGCLISCDTFSFLTPEGCSSISFASDSNSTTSLSAPLPNAAD
jgi:hypothetical protein